MTCHRLTLIKTGVNFDVFDDLGISVFALDLFFSIYTGTKFVKLCRIEKKSNIASYSTLKFTYFSSLAIYNICLFAFAKWCLYTNNDIVDIENIKTEKIKNTCFLINWFILSLIRKQMSSDTQLFFVWITITNFYCTNCSK